MALRHLFGEVHPTFNIMPSASDFTIWCLGLYDTVDAPKEAEDE